MSLLIANSPQVEPLIDFIPIKHVGNGEGNHKYGKNPCILHLPLFYKEERIFVELVATKRISINKEEILVTNPSMEYKLCPESPEILKSWLSARYNRHALPNNLVERIRPIMDFIEKELRTRRFFNLVATR